MIRDKSINTLILLLILLLPAVYIRKKISSHDSGMNPHNYWQSKKYGSQTADIVILGDSRTFGGVAPSILEQYIPGEIHAYNFGFESFGMNSYMFDKAELKMGSDRDKPKTFVLGISPHSLLKKTVGNSHYHSIQKNNIYMNRYFTPLDLTDTIKEMLNKKNDIYYHHYHVDGWCSMNITPRNPGIWPPIYKAIFQRHKVDSDIINQIITYTSKWNKAGIYVFAFRPPTNINTYNIENKYSGFDLNDFVKRFENAGGLWFDAPQEDAVTIDGSHLDEDSAILLSQRLAQFIAEKMTKKHKHQ